MKKNIFILLVFFTMFAFAGTAQAFVPVPVPPPVVPLCLTTLSPTSHSFSSSAGSITVMVYITHYTCNWTATKSDSWITLSTTSGTGDGSVIVSVSANLGIARSGTVTIGGRTFTVQQAGQTPTPCTWKIDPTSHSFSSSAGSITVGVLSNCAWPVTKSASWITLSKTSGSGDGSVVVGVLENTSTSSRIGTVTIGSASLAKTFTVQQAGQTPTPCTWDISPASHSFSSSAGSITVNVVSNCSWPVAKSASWITLSTTSGSGNGSVIVGVLENTSISSRTGTVTIGSATLAETFYVSQGAAFIPVTYSYEYFQPYYASSIYVSPSDVDWTGVALSNASNYHEASIEIVVRGTNGSLITEIYKSLPASGKTTLVINDLGTGWVHVRSDQPLSGLVFLGRGLLMADIPFVDNLEQNLVIPHIAQDITWDTTIMLCNPQSSSVNVNVINVNEQGIMVAQRSLTLAAKGSGSYLLSDLFESQALTGKIYLQASSGISAFGLYSNVKSGGSYFAGINAAPEIYIIKY